MRFSIFHGAKDNTPKPGDLAWPDFVKSITPHKFRPYADKLLCDAFSPATFTEGATRANANVEAISMFVADLDAVSDDEIERFSKAVTDHGWACLMHTTWSHYAKPNSLRAILPLSRPASPEEWPDLWDRINDALGAYADPQCRDLARLYFRAAAPERTYKSAFCHTFKGDPVPVDDLPDTSPTTSREHVTSEQLRRFARMLSRKRDDVSQERGTTITRILAGEQFAEPGNIDTTIFNLSLLLAERFVDADPESIAGHFMASLAQMMRTGVSQSEWTLEKVAYKIDRAQQTLRRERDAIERDFEVATKRRIKDAFGTDRDEPYTKAEYEKTPPHRWIIQKGRSYYARVGDDYRGPYTQDEAQSAITRDLAPAHPHVELYTVSAQGERAPKTLGRLVREVSFVANDVAVSLSAQKAYFDEKARTLVEAPTPLRQIKPHFYPEIDKWLDLLGGENAHLLKAWIKYVTKLKKPCTALFLTGHKMTGKSVIAEGLSKLWTPLGLPTPLETVLGTSFNDSQLRCPLVFADERLPTDHRGRVLNAELRHYIQARRRPLRRKFLPNSDMLGAVRLIISANNEEILSTTENLSNHDIGAIVDRYLHIPVKIDAYHYLQDVDASTWVEEDKIASHALWLRDKHPHKPNGRFLVHAEDNELHSRLISGSGIRSAVLQFCVGYLLDPVRVDNDARGAYWIRVNCGRLCVNPRVFINCWGHYVSNEACPPTGRLASAVNALSTDVSTRLRIPGSGRPNYKIIDPAHLVAWGVQTGFATKEEIDKALEQDTEKRAKHLAPN